MNLGYTATLDDAGISRMGSPVQTVTPVPGCAQRGQCARQLEAGHTRRMSLAENGAQGSSDQ